MTQEQTFAKARKILRGFGLQVESVAWIHRGDDDEFAAIVVSNHWPAAMDEALTVLTDPRCPVRVVREHVGVTDTRIYVAF